MRYYLPNDSQHKHLEIGSKLGYLTIESKPFHIKSKPKRVLYAFRCDCGKEYINTIIAVRYNSKKYAPHCGCRSKLHHKQGLSTKQHYCKMCGTTDEQKFEQCRKTICRNCRYEDKSAKAKILRQNPAFRGTDNDRIKKLRQRTPNSFLQTTLTKLHQNNRRYPNKIQYKCDLDISYLMDIWDNNHGKCKITKLQMTHNYNSLNSVSVDRINNSNGHVKNNIQLVCKWINLGRLEYDLQEFVDILNRCRSNDDRTNTIDPRNYLRHTLNVIRHRCSRYRSRFGKHNLTLDSLCALFHSQKSKCAMTGLTMSLSKNCLDSCSIDRVHNDKSYTQNNIQLVCRWANTARRNHTVEEFKNTIHEFKEQQMIIRFPNEHTYVFERDMIQFLAIADSKPVICRITMEEMIRKFGRGGEPATFEDDFRSLRPQIEKLVIERITKRKAIIIL